MSRSPFRLIGGLLVGFCLVLALHACQPSSSSSAGSALDSAAADAASDAAAQPAESDTSSGQASEERPEAAAENADPLPPETQALIASAGPDGLFSPPRGDVRLVVISDLNGAYGSTDYDPEIDQAMTLLPFWNPDLVVCSGDMVAGQKLSLSDAQLQAMWAAFDDHVAAPLRRMNLPFGFTMGNHDASAAKSSSGGFVFERERAIATTYWNNPAHDPGIEFVDRNTFPFYYTFRFQDVFVVVWDGSSSRIPPDKLAWVEQALESPAAQSAKLKILLGHLPLYAVANGRDRPGEVMDNASQLQAMLERHQVHTYISGHQHAYYPAHKGDLQLLHAGILGSGPRSYVGSQQRSPKTITVMDVDFDNPDLTAYTTYDMATLQVIELEQLPRAIAGHNGMVLRRDIEAADLTAAERSACRDHLGIDELCRA